MEVYLKSVASVTGITRSLLKGVVSVTGITGSLPEECGVLDRNDRKFT